MLEGCKNLTDVERHLKEEVRKVSLLSQIPFSDEDFRILRRAVIEAASLDFSSLKERGGLSLSCFLVWMGIEHYDRGIFWPEVEKALGKTGGNWQHRWGEIFLDTIKRFKLPFSRLTEGLTNVTPILLHGGIPDYCLPDFFEKVLDPIVRGRLDLESNTAEELVFEWRSRFPSLYQITQKPVQRFLEQGGKPAADFLNRCIEMMRASYDERFPATASEMCLPERIVQKFEEWSRRHHQPGLTESRIALRRPWIELITAGGAEVYCVLPEQIIDYDGDCSVSFCVTADGDMIFSSKVQQYKRRNLLFTERDECALPPARKYNIRLFKNGELLREWSVEGVTSQGWIAFDDNCRLAGRNELPRSDFWLVFDNCMRLDSNVVPSESAEGEGEWKRYVCLRIDASDRESLALLDEANQQIPLPLADTREPVIRGEPVSGCHIEGLPLFTGELPRIEIPLDGWESIDSWSVVFEDLTHRIPRRERSPLNEVCRIEPRRATLDYSRAGWSDAKAGKYRVNLRGRITYGRYKQFHFAFIREFVHGFDRPFYKVGETVKLTLLTDPDFKITSEDPSILVENQEGAFEIEARAESRSLDDPKNRK
jgi:hypothetical protein